MASRQWCCSDLDITEVSYQWRIEKFSYRLQSAVGKRLYSSLFYSGHNKQEQWQLFSCFGGLSDETQHYIPIYLRLRKCMNCPLDVEVQFSVLGTNKQAYAIHRRRASMSVGNEIGVRQFILKLAFIKNLSVFLPQDTLTICCKLRILREVSHTSSFHNANFALMSVTNKHRLNADLKSFLQSSEYSDVTLVIGDERIPAHKMILAVRSPVFSAMFSHKEMRENLNNEVVIQTITPATVKQMLNYIYSDTVHSKSDAYSLLAAAEMYQLLGLKAKCEMMLLEQMNVDNVADFLIYANLHHAKELKSGAMDFIFGHESEVGASEGYKVLKKHPSLLAELYQGRLSKKMRNK